MDSSLCSGLIAEQQEIILVLTALLEKTSPRFPSMSVAVGSEESPKSAPGAECMHCVA